jgi:hypothetical protein
MTEPAKPCYREANGALRRASHIGFDAGWDAHAAFAEPEVQAAIEAAYQEGWSDACSDFIRQAKEPSHPIGANHRYNRAREAS